MWQYIQYSEPNCIARSSPNNWRTELFHHLLPPHIFCKLEACRLTQNPSISDPPVWLLAQNAVFSASRQFTLKTHFDVQGTSRLSALWIFVNLCSRRGFTSFSKFWYYFLGNLFMSNGGKL